MEISEILQITVVAILIAVVTIKEIWGFLSPNNILTQDNQIEKLEQKLRVTNNLSELCIQEGLSDIKNGITDMKSDVDEIKSQTHEMHVWHNIDDPSRPGSKIWYGHYVTGELKPLVDSLNNNITKQSEILTKQSEILNIIVNKLVDLDSDVNRIKGMKNNGNSN